MNVMTADSAADPNNFARVAIALERWIHTGEILVSCIDQTGDTANVQRVSAVKKNVQQLTQLISQLRG
jgi:hypothetical protein